MKKITISVLRNGSSEPLVTGAGYAESFLERLRGLLPNGPGAGAPPALFLPRCNQVHMCFMRRPLDIVFLSAGEEVVHICHRLQPWRFSPRVAAALNVLELESGAAEAASLLVGEQLQVSEVCRS